MKILMIAPEPFFEPRGTPFSEYFRIRALSELGHEVDLATYPLGQNMNIPGLRIFRSLPVPGIKRVKVGPSIGKLLLDFFLFFTVLRLLIKNRYEAIHTHEEAVFWGTLLCKLWRVPHVYDMHSSLPQQFKNFNIVHAAWIHRIFQAFENFALKSTDAIIAICPYLKDHVVASGIKKKIFVIENSPESEMTFPGEQQASTNLPEFPGKKIVLYAGTFEAYQGLDMLLESIPIVAEKEPDVLFLMIGGVAELMDLYRQKAAQLNMESHLILMEKISAADVRHFLNIADVLVSPRKSGTNTPLKIYSYLRSGKPIVATNLITHTQVLNPEIAILTEPNTDSFASGILRALEDPEIPRIVKNAQKVAEEKYSYKEYVSKVAQLYGYVESLHNKPALSTATKAI
jgi:glycosyltransferase involved in cell wall biosynthesis